MTKPKRPRPPKAVLCWCTVTNSGIHPSTSSLDKQMALDWAHHLQGYLIRVEIRPAPKRKAKRGAK